MTLSAVLDGWEQENDESTSLRPSVVQNRLLELHDQVGGEAQRAVEQWLVASLERSLYTQSEVASMIRMLRELPQEAAPELLERPTAAP